LYERGYQRQDILELLRFIDWMLRLPEILELQLKQDIILVSEEQKMKYVTSWERMAEARGEAKGKAEGEAKALLKLLKLRFSSLPAWVEEKVSSANVAQLDQWLDKILTAESVESLLESSDVNSRG
jgi:hypothetical protein